ncbi:biopolymer transporter ExbD [Subsaxibacter sp. CAU 1640]|uniref:ExbD/TolR family protein n=1 Tax=Subsaxibacter sp. CAU 1640 TaxID=2933271 RepID=UPI002002BE21|nr:biopolymer transporter ExbD [Subsaxibacter sp. CAU 1640]MCK7590962.1 biopolymer transporter ExbD [Subsaxibacter sp. CAU 1640]
MKTPRHNAPQVNAGSMADIAFLLLIFFLVTTTISADKGINRKLPEMCPPNTNCNIDINERNILRVSINGNDELFIEEDKASIKDLKQIAKAFLDNNGDTSCSYCNGLKDPKSSDNPKEAIISLSNDNFTSYEMYVVVQDVLTQAYYELRKDYGKNVFGKTESQLNEQQVKEMKEAYPFILSEAQTRN